MKAMLRSASPILGMLVLAVFSLMGCEKESNNPQPYFEVDGNGHSRFNGGSLAGTLGTLPHEAVSEAESSGLLFMREEEKLAHDVYLRLYERWGVNVFTNIAQSEQTHTEAVLQLIQKYNLTDPVGTNGVGVFTNTVLQGLFNDLTVAGQASEIAALQVGAAIEEIDILDIQTQLDDYVDNQDITLVYESLMKGSRNHLRSFVSNLANRGVTYIPQYLSQAAYDEIIGSAMENGH